MQNSESFYSVARWFRSAPYIYPHNLNCVLLPLSASMKWNEKNTLLRYTNGKVMPLKSPLTPYQKKTTYFVYTLLPGVSSYSQLIVVL